MCHTLTFESWGRFPKVYHLGAIAPRNISEVEAAIQSADSLILPRGLGRSYGDSCLNENGYLLSTKWLNKFIAFDAITGLLRCESGVTLDEILQVFVPKGWFLPVTPGTKFVTVGGAIANDIHGKNHHRTGSFGNHVTHFELLRSDGTRRLCSRSTNADWFRATIGGLGLTGVILWAELALRSIHSPYLRAEYIKFKNLDEFCSLSSESAQEFEYTVAWMDCLNSGSAFGRGIFIRGNHDNNEKNNSLKSSDRNSWWGTVPMDASSFLLSKAAGKAFNFLFYHKQMRRHHANKVYYDRFFYPLDKIKRWNRMYGEQGFLQWQCVVPFPDKNEAVTIILKKISESKRGSFLAVLKDFGNVAPEGMLSFPVPGITLALDFANVGERLFKLLDKLDDIVVHFGGRIYPAKDARMAGRTFQSSFPEFETFARYVDPKFSSSFYRRVTGTSCQNRKRF